MRLLGVQVATGSWRLGLQPRQPLLPEEALLGGKACKAPGEFPNTPRLQTALCPLLCLRTKHLG